MSTALASKMESALADALRERGQRVTPQRLAVARVLERQDAHVSADRLFAEVGREMPGISLPTVYATLELLEQLGLVRRVLTEGGSAIYDPRTDGHHHLVCSGCGEVFDLEAPVDDCALLNAARASGFEPDFSQVVVSGLCPSCRS